MRVRLNTRILSLALAVTGLLALPTAALAYAPTGGAFVACTPASAGAGDEVSCNAGVYAAGTTATITVSSGQNLRATAATTAVVDANGQVAFTFTATEAGGVQVTVSGFRVLGGPLSSVSSAVNVSSVLGVSLDATDGDGNAAVDGADVGTDAAVSGTDAADEVAATGSDAGGLAVIAIGAIAIGGGALVASRRQRSSTAA